MKTLFATVWVVLLLPVSGISQTNTSSNSTTDDFSSNRSRFHLTEALRQKNQYEALEKLDSLIEFNYNSDEEIWDVPFKKKAYQYNLDFQLTTSTLSSWSATNEIWSELMRETYNYTSSGKLSEYQLLVSVDGNWNNQFKELYTYTESDELKELITFSWKPQRNDWVMAEKWEYHYNEAGQPLADSLFWWEESTEEWLVREKTTYEYINDKIHYIRKFLWNDTLETWEPMNTSWYLYTYQTWLLYLVSHYEWENDDEIMVSRESYGYSDDENLNSHTTISKSTQSTGWQTMLKEQYQYNFDIAAEALLFPESNNMLLPSFQHHKIIEKDLLQYNFDTKEYEQYRAVQYYYSSTDNIVAARRPEATSHHYQLYPNPASDYITVGNMPRGKQGKLQLMDYTGNIIWESKFEASEKLDINGVPPGIYVYRITFSDSVQTGKVLVK
jgi:hypothetical protein